MNPRKNDFERAVSLLHRDGYTCAGCKGCKGTEPQNRDQRNHQCDRTKDDQKNSHDLQKLRAFHVGFPFLSLVNFADVRRASAARQVHETKVLYHILHSLAIFRHRASRVFKAEAVLREAYAENVCMETPTSNQQVRFHGPEPALRCFIGLTAWDIRGETSGFGTRAARTAASEDAAVVPNVCGGDQPPR